MKIVSKMKRISTLVIILVLVASILAGCGKDNSKEGNTLEGSTIEGNTWWHDFTIIVLTAAATGVTNLFVVRSELQKAKKEKLNEKRIDAYEDCMSIIERNIAHCNIVFEREFSDSLVALKRKMKLVASNKVMQAFEKYYKWVIDLHTGYSDFCNENDPINKGFTEFEVNGNIVQEPNFTEQELQNWPIECEIYKKKRHITYDLVVSNTETLRNAMRSDLGNDVYTPVSFN